jgi:hypothetical protein
VDPFRPVEVSLLTNQARSEGDWSTTINPKAKTNLVPTGIGKFGFAFYAGGSFDALTGETLAAFAVVPATFRLSETMLASVSTGSSPMSCNGPSRRSVRPARPICQVWSVRDFRPACDTDPTRFSPSI